MNCTDGDSYGRLGFTRVRLDPEHCAVNRYWHEKIWLKVLYICMMRWLLELKVSLA